MNKTIVQLGDPILRLKAKELSINEIKNQKIKDLIHFMKKVMRNAPGVGLAAPQIGVPLQIAVIEDCEEKWIGYDAKILKERGRYHIDFHVIINPKIKIISEETELFFESCLSVQGVSRITPRARSVVVECLDENANKKIIHATGWHARILQHEIDHLNGILYVDFANLKTEIINNEISMEMWKNAPSKKIREHYNKIINDDLS